MDSEQTSDIYRWTSIKTKRQPSFYKGLLFRAEMTKTTEININEEKVLIVIKCLGHSGRLTWTFFNPNVSHNFTVLLR